MTDLQELSDGPVSTLFDKNYEEFLETDINGFPYTLSIEGLSRDGAETFPEMESSVFADVIRHEVMIHEPRGYLAGPIELEILDHESGQPKYVNLRDQARSLPAWVEKDAVSIVRCDARGVLLVDRQAHFERLHQQDVCARFHLILATGLGIPRLAMRRFLRRLQLECRLPVFVLVDNDTWGYFFFSVLTRGALPPHTSCQHLRIDDVRYLGLRADDQQLLNRAGSPSRPWNSQWDLRLEKMREYRCFQSSSWRSEFDAFQKQQCAFDLITAINAYGDREFMNNYLKVKFEANDWLT